jgi:glycosyltransferase involved in cell wall biosynthesis
MRILKVTETYFPFLEKGGPPVKVRALARGLARRGHHVTVLTADFGIAGRGVSGLVRSAFGWHLEEDGVESVYLPSLLRYRALSWNPKARSFCRRRLSAFDVVHVFGLYDLLGPAVSAACRRRGIPYVLEPMGMFRPIVRSLRLKRLFHAGPGRAMIQGARRVIATASQEADELVAGGVPREKIVLRRNGVESPGKCPEAGTFRRKWGIPAQAKLILFLGRVVQKKSPELLLEAFARWRVSAGNGGGARVVFAGPFERDGMRARLETLERKHGLQGQTVYTGALYGDAKWAAYRDADVFVLPSQNENFGNSAAESVACGTPVIVTENCGIAPHVTGRAGLVVPHNAEAIAAALARILGDAALHTQFVSGCPEVTASLDWEEPAAQMESLYQTLVVEHRRE